MGCEPDMTMQEIKSALGRPSTDKAVPRVMNWLKIQPVSSRYVPKGCRTVATYSRKEIPRIRTKLKQFLKQQP